MNILVTGGGGFLGQHLIKALVKRGYSVTSFSRSHYQALDNIGAKQISGDITNLSDVMSALEKIDACFHVASKVAMWGKWQDFYATNVTGTQNIIKACQHNNVNHLIYTSTPSVAFGSDSLEGVDESIDYPTKTTSLYGRSKAMAEKEALIANSKSLNVISLRPHLIFGPGDQNLIPGLLSAAKNGKLKIVGKGQNKVDVLYVENAVDAHLCALDTMINKNEEAFGKAYFIGQGPVKLWEFINKVLKQSGLDPINKKVNFKLTYFIGFVTEIIYKLFNIRHDKPPMTRFVALQLAKHHYFDHKSAHTLLKWKPKVNIDDGILKSLK